MDWNKAYETGAHREHWDASFPSPELVGFIMSLSDKKKLKALDIGCGTGEDALFLSRHAGSATGLDISQIALQIARDKARDPGSTAAFVQGNVFFMPFGEGEFNLATDRGCLHNLPLGEWRKYEAEIYRILSESGIFFLRGARRTPEYGEGFVFIDSENIQAAFPSERWERSEVVPFTMVSDAGPLKSNLVIMKKL